MPQLIAIGLIGGLVYYAWRALKREMARIGDEVASKEKPNAPLSGTILEKGPDGVYRPRND